MNNRLVLFYRYTLLGVFMKDYKVTFVLVFSYFGW